MGKFEKYKIDLKGMTDNSFSCSFQLDDRFFADVDATEISKGKLTVDLDVKKKIGVYELSFRTEGYVIVSCDRCLDDMEQPISTSDKLLVKLGADYSEENDIVIIPEEEGAINVAWFIYEFIVLNIPIKHTHPFGKCNRDMMSELSKHSAGEYDEDSEESDSKSAGNEMDPRWNELKKIIDNN